MTVYSFHKVLDMVVSAILSLFLLLGYVFRSSPVNFMNPGFPILRKDDLKLSEMFRLQGTWYETPKRITNINNSDEVAYEMVFHLGDATQIFPDMTGTPNPTEFSVFHDVRRFQNAGAAEIALTQSYAEYRSKLSEFLGPLTDIPLQNFTSRADHSLLWCDQVVSEPVFDVYKVGACYYWAVYDRYLAKTRISLWTIASGDRQFSLKLFGEVITLAEDKLLGEIRAQR